MFNNNALSVDACLENDKITLAHITYVFNVANAGYSPRKLLTTLDKNRNLNLLTRNNKKWI